MLSSRLEKTLNRAFGIAAENNHEYVTLEHLLSALIDDEDANEVLISCNVDIEELRVWSKENNFSEIISVSQNKINRIEV